MSPAAKNIQLDALMLRIDLSPCLVYYCNTIYKILAKQVVTDEIDEAKEGKQMQTQTYTTETAAKKAAA